MKDGWDRWKGRGVQEQGRRYGRVIHLLSRLRVCYLLSFVSIQGLRSEKSIVSFYR